ncbi:hypothetical protein ACIBAC_00545 [Streptomyces sp. NPDC051362]|uniref:hypothetical protein n=1 Tax=Streptomyces sp. NPDC051362 TaxID=3365651 RepID=UPI0037A02A18
MTRLRAQGAMLLGHPLIIMIQPETMAYTSESGELLAADTNEVAMRAAGGQALTLPPDFSDEPVDGWAGTLDLATDELLLHFPSGHVFYDGTLPTTEGWVDQVRAAGSVIVVTGPMATLQDIEPLLMAGRLLWTRVPLVIR